jgi:hypothetical protein
MIALEPHQTLAGAAAPAIANVPFRVEATVHDSTRGGVIASQGAQLNGWSLFVRDRKPVFAVRRDGTLFELTADCILGDDQIELTGELSGDGTVRVLLDGVEIASGDAGGFIPAQPNDPLIVGDDRMGPVGSYETPRPFRGSIHRARLTRQELHRRADLVGPWDHRRG